MNKIINSFYNIRFRYLIWSTDRLLELVRAFRVLKAHIEVIRAHGTDASGSGIHVNRREYGNKVLLR